MGINSLPFRVFIIPRVFSFYQWSLCLRSLHSGASIMCVGCIYDTFLPAVGRQFASRMSVKMFSHIFATSYLCMVAQSIPVFQTDKTSAYAYHSTYFLVSQLPWSQDHLIFLLWRFIKILPTACCKTLWIHPCKYAALIYNISPFSPIPSLFFREDSVVRKYWGPNAPSSSPCTPSGPQHCVATIDGEKFSFYISPRFEDVPFSPSHLSLLEENKENDVPRGFPRPLASTPIT